MTNDLSAYKELYVKTAQEYLEAVDASMVLFVSDENNREAIDTLYRSFHSLKSQSLMMGYKNTASLCQYLEVTFRNVKEGKVLINEKFIKEIKEAIQKITQSIDSIDKVSKEITFGEPITN